MKAFKFAWIGLFCSLSLMAQVPGSPYIASISASTGTATFNYTGAIQTWTVPTGVTLLTVTARGAQGGGTTGGKGAKVRAVIPLTAGQTLYFGVGGRTTNNVAVYGKGAAGALYSGAPTAYGYAGGGMSGIFTSSTLSQAACKIVAGGGGGQTNGYTGGAGGNPGTAGGQGNYSGYSEGGKGGTQTGGGAAGVSFDAQNAVTNAAGAALAGGRGGATNNAGHAGGGGGGAGYFGGGGGAGGGSSRGAAGGGSSWVVSGSSSVVYTSNAILGNGGIVISW